MPFLLVMSLMIFIAAALSSAPSIAQITGDNASKQSTATQKTAPRRRAKATLVASATIIRHEKVNPLIIPVKPNSEVERPIAQQRVIKAGVPYVEFY